MKASTVSRIFSQGPKRQPRVCSMQAIFERTLKALQDRSPEMLDFLNYSHIVAFLQNKEPCEVLELGAGYSSVITAYLAYITGCNSYSISSSFDIFKEWLAADEIELLKKYCTCMKGLGISVGDLEPDRYSDIWRSAAMGHEDVLGRCLRPFVQMNSKYWRFYQRQAKYFQISPMHICNMLFSKEALTPIASRKESFEKAYRRAKILPVHDNLLRDRFLSKSVQFDMVFFNAGEYESLIDWTLLREAIKPGGFAVLKDIYFPFSTKNYLVASQIASDSRWKILFMDRETPSGLLIAQRVET